MSKQPLFSILIVNYNYGAFLRDCIKSILTQNFDNYELLVIDAASSDNSIDIILEFENSIDWWISEPDSGQSEAFNKGFRMANGDFFLWVNADDILLPGSLSLVSEHLINYPNSNWIAGNTIFFDINGMIINCASGSKWSYFTNGGCFIPVFGPSCIFRRNLLEEVGWFDETLHYSMDTDLWIRFRLFGYKYDRLDSYIWGFRIHNQSKTSSTHSGKKIVKMDLEKKIIKMRYCDDNLLPIRIFCQRILRLFDGSFFISVLNTIRLKGLPIKEYSLKSYRRSSSI